MAEATQATTDVIATQTDATASPADGAATSTEPVGAQERVAAALARLEASRATATEQAAEGETTASEQAADGEQTKTEPAKEPEPAKATEGKKPDEKKPEDPRLSRGLALLAEREEKVRKTERAIQAERANWEKERAAKQQADAADLQLLYTVRERLAKDGQVGALEAMGIDLPKAVELMSRRVEPTPEDIQRKIVREEIEARENAAREAAAKAEREKAEAAAANEQVQQAEFLDRVQSLDDKAYPYTVQRKVNGAQIWDVQKRLAGELGRAVTPKEVVDKIEGILSNDAAEVARMWLLNASQEDVDKILAGRPKPAETPKPTAKPADEAKAKAPEKGKTEPVAQQGRRPGRRDSVMDRVEAALRARNIH